MRCPYAAFLHLLRGARLEVSDSGGIQEEGPTLGVPVLVTRQVTERPEGVAASAVRLIGTDADAIRHGVVSLLRSPPTWRRWPGPVEACTATGMPRAGSSVAIADA